MTRNSFFVPLVDDILRLRQERFEAQDLTLDWRKETCRCGRCVRRLSQTLLGFASVLFIEEKTQKSKRVGRRTVFSNVMERSSTFPAFWKLERAASAELRHRCCAVQIRRRQYFKVESISHWQRVQSNPMYSLLH